MTIQVALRRGGAVSVEATGDFAGFYRASYPSVVAQLFALTGNKAEAEEVAQEAFMRAWSRWSTVGTYDQPGAWVVRVGSRLAVSRWRHARSTVKAFVRHGEEDGGASEPGPHTVALVTALKRIPLAQRRALVLHHMGGLSVAEIAEIESVAEGTIKARLSRGRDALAPLLSDEPAERPAANKEVFGDA